MAGLCASYGSACDGWRGHAPAEVVDGPPARGGRLATSARRRAKPIEFALACPPRWPHAPGARQLCFRNAGCETFAAKTSATTPSTATSPSFRAAGWRGRGRRAADHRPPLGAAAAANPSIANRLVGLSDRRAHALSARRRRHAPGQPGRGGAVRQPARGVPRRAQPRLRRIAGADGRPAARRGPRAVRPLFRRALSAGYRPESRDARQRDHLPTSWATCCAGIRRNPNGQLEPANSSIPARSPF